MEYDSFIKHVPGKKVADIFVFALSTCVWCKKTKKLLDELGVEYKYVDVDLLEGPAKIDALREMHRWDPSQSFPTIIINNSDCILGYKEGLIRKALGE